MTHEPSASKVIVVTGASDGIGRAAARDLSARGHQVVVVGRSAQKTRAVANDLGAPSYLVDFAELDSVRDLATTLDQDFERIDVLANNAGGVFGPDRVLTGDGHEMTFQVNYLAPFLLTGLLAEKLISSNATVVNTSSVAHRIFGHLDLSDLEGEAKRFVPRRAYGTAKLAQILFTKELAHRYGQRGLAAAAFHPGIIGSGFASQPGAALGFIYNNPISKRFLGSPESGASTLVWLAEHCPSAQCPSGGYFAQERQVRPSKQARDPQLAARLWDMSAALTNLQLP